VEDVNGFLHLYNVQYLSLREEAREISSVDLSFLILVVEAGAEGEAGVLRINKSILQRP
jgi:hypothetical protein